MGNPGPWKPTRRERRVLLELLSDKASLSGSQLARVAQTGSGTTHATLVHLKRHGWVTHEDDDGYAGTGRRSCRLTPDGRTAARELLGLTAPGGKR